MCASRAVRAFVIPAVAAALLLAYLRVAGSTPVTSDGAGDALQAWAVLHGNLLLHGWWATDVSFYTTELPEYVLAEAFAGLRPEVVHVCAAVTYTLLVLLAALAARGRARGAEGAARALLAAMILLAPQPGWSVKVLLGDPDHVGTGVLVLVLVLLLDRGWGQGRAKAGPRWYVPAGAAVLLAWASVGDPLAEVVGAAPLAAACLIRACRGLRGGGLGDRGRAAGREAVPLLSRIRAVRPELALAAAAAASVPLAAAGSWLIRALGGFRVAGAGYGMLGWPTITRDLPAAGQSVLALFGADFTQARGGLGLVFACAHLTGLALVLAAVAVAAGRLLRGRGDLVTDVLVIAVLANVAAYLAEVRIVNAYGAHEIGPVLSLGAALAGRVLGGALTPARLRSPGRLSSLAGAAGLGSPRRWLVPALAAGLACYAVMLGFAAALPQAPPQSVALTAWLARHRLTSGLGPYWEDSSVMLDSGGRIDMVSVLPSRSGRLAPRRWEADLRLADPAAHDARFVVIAPGEPVTREEALVTFGQPALVYRYEDYTVLVWHANLLRRLAPAPALNA